MTEYEELVAKAYELVDQTNRSFLEGNNMAYVGLILGMGPCFLEDYEGNGHCFRAVDDAIHLYFQDQPNSRVDKGFIDGIGYAIDKFPFTETFDTVVSYLKYELQKAKKGENTFEFDALEILTDVKLFIAANIGFLKNDPEFLFWIESQDEYFIKNYGYSISEGIEL